MNIHVRLPRALLDRMRTDLLRPHSFAFERVGFVRTRVGNTGGEPQLVLLDDYTPVPDGDYIPDDSCGARFSGAAIRRAMQQVLSDGRGVIHVHMHHHRGRPALSDVDVADLPRVVSSFHAVGPQVPHGILLLSLDQCRAWIHAVNQKGLVEAARVNVVGFPMGFFA